MSGRKSYNERTRPLVDAIIKKFQEPQIETVVEATNYFVQSENSPNYVENLNLPVEEDDLPW